MKVSEKLFICSIKASIVIDYVLSYSIGRAVIDFLKIAATPFIISTILSLLTLFESKKWNPVLIGARDEFMQVTGLKLSSYIIIILVGVSFIVYSFDVLTRFIAKFVTLISNVGFVINAVLGGVVLGTLVSGFFGVENNISTRFKFEFWGISLLLFLIFNFSKEVLPNRIKKDITEILEKPITWFIPLIFGLALTALGISALIAEEWSELAENQKEIACKATS